MSNWPKLHTLFVASEYVVEIIQTKGIAKSNLHSCGYLTNRTSDSFQRMRPEFEFKVKKRKENPITNVSDKFNFSIYCLMLGILVVFVWHLFGWNVAAKPYLIYKRFICLSMLFLTVVQLFNLSYKRLWQQALHGLIVSRKLVQTGRNEVIMPILVRIDVTLGLNNIWNV